MQDVTPNPVRDILEQNSPYNRTIRGGPGEPASASPQYNRPAPLPDIEAPPIARPNPLPVNELAEPAAKPAPKVVAKEAEDVTKRPFAKTSDSDIEFLAKTGDTGALAEAKLRPTLKEKLGYLFNKVSGEQGAIGDIKNDPNFKGDRTTGHFEEGEGGLADLTAGKIKPHAMPEKPSAIFAFDWPEAGGKKYHIVGGEHSGSTVGAQQLKELGIEIPTNEDPSIALAARDAATQRMKDNKAKRLAETTPAIDDRSVVQKVVDIAKKMKEEKGSITFGPDEHADLRKANKVKAKDWATQREAANHHGQFAADDFKDLKDKPELIDKFQDGDRSGRLADVEAHFNKLYEDELAAGIFTGKKMPKENYLRQMYKPEIVEDSTPAVKGGVVAKNPAFAKKSTYATYREARAAGHEPLYDNLSDIIGARTRESKIAIANKRFDDYLNETSQKTPEMTIKEPTQVRFHGPMSAQLGKYTSDVLQGAPKELNATAQAVAKTKNIYLAGGIPGTPLNIHGWNTARSRYMASGIKGLSDFGKGIFKPSRDIKYLKSERPLIQRAIDFGYQMSSEQESMDAIEKVLHKSMVGRGVNKFFDLEKKVFEDPLFKISLPANKARVLRENYDRLLPKVGEEAALRQASTIANDFMGGINKSLRNKTYKDLLQIGVLAPDWAESRINLTVKGAKALAGKEDPIYAKALGRGGIMRGVGAAAAATTAAYGMRTGNKPSDLTSVGLGETESGRTREAPIYGTAVEALRMPEEAIRGAMTGDFSPVSRIVRNRLSQPLQSSINMVYNQDAFGNPLSGKDKYNKKIPFTDAMWNYGNEATAPFQPQQLQSLTGYLRGKQGGEESISQALELPVKYSTPRSTPTRRGRSRGRHH
jgi:hypothetical protein